MKMLMTVMTVAALGLATVGLWAADETTTTAPPTIVVSGDSVKSGTVTFTTAAALADTTAAHEGHDSPGKMSGMRHGMGGPMGMRTGMMGMGRKMEKATFLGVGVSPTSPVLQAQLSLPKGSGMVVDVVEKDSPAEKAGLKQYDIVAKLNDQILFNMPQLSALVRTFKAGDAVTLTVLHEGKSTQVSATLAEKEQPAMEMGGMGMMPGMSGMPGMGGMPGMPGMPNMRGMSGMPGMMMRMQQGMGGPEGFQPRDPGRPDREGRDGFNGGRKGRQGRDGRDDDDDNDDNDDHSKKQD